MYSLTILELKLFIHNATQAPIENPSHNGSFQGYILPKKGHFMNKTQCLQYYAKDSETRNFYASSLDKSQQAQNHQQHSNTGFFAPEEQEDFTHILNHLAVPQGYVWSGGYEDSTRQICCFPPPWADDVEIPLCVVKGQCHQSISHRDVLGSLMGLGITRRKIGDILIHDTQCQVIVLEEIAPILLTQWSSIGRQSISLTNHPLEDLLIPEKKSKEITSTVATLRLDSLVATGFSLSRSKASQLIAGGGVSINHRECKKVDKQLVEGDVLVCRGYGKCTLTQVKGESRKGRILVVMERLL